MTTRRWSRWLRPSSEPGLLLIAIVAGAGAGAGAAILIKCLEIVGKGTQRVADLPAFHDAWMLVTVPAGMLLAWGLTTKLAPEVAGHGVPQIIASLSTAAGRIRARVPVLKTVATALTIGGGGSAGREGSIAQIGAGIGSLVGQIEGLSEQARRSLVAAGAGAGIAATFNAPIAGMFFAMEVVLGDLSVRYLHTVVAASVAGAVISHSLIGEGLTFSVSPFAVDDAWQLVLYAALGLIAFVFALLYIDTLDWFETRTERLRSFLRPLVLGLVVAFVGLALPDVLGTGQGFIQSVLSEVIDMAWWMLALLALAKIIATSATLGGRGSGGIFMPSLFIGAVAGSAFAQISAHVWHRSVLHPGAFALVGMAAVFAGVARAPLTSILIVFEITGDYGLVMPLMLAVAISVLLSNRFHPESAYTAPLLRMGIHPRPQHVDLLDTVSVGDLGLRRPVVVAPNDTLAEVDGVMYRNRLHGVPVVEEGRLIGIITQSDVIRAGGPSDQTRVREAMTPDPATVVASIPVSEALERMAQLGVGRLPVVAANDRYQLISLFKREHAVSAYHHALGSAARGDRSPERAQVRSSDSTGFFEYEVVEGSVADGRKVREVPWPEGCIVVSIHRGTRLLIPSGEVTIAAGDALTVFGDEDSRMRLAERLRASTESE